MSIQSLDLDFEKTPIHFFHGENGSGKSSVIFSLAFSLLNFKKGDSFKDYVNHNSDKAEIYFEFLLHGVLHQLSIIVPGQESQNVQRNLVVQNKVFKNSDVIQYLESNLDFSLVQSIIFSFQGDVNNFVSLTPAKKSEVLRSILNVEFSSELEKIDNKKQQIKNIILKNETELNYLKSLSFELLEKVETISDEEFYNLESKRERIAKELSEIILEYNQFSGIVRQFEDLKNQYEHKKLKVQSLNQQIDRLNQSLPRLEEEKEKIQSDIQYRQKLLEKAKNIWNSYQEKSFEKSKSLTELEILLKTKEQHLEDHKQGICPRCRRPLDKREEKDLEQEIFNLRDQYQYLKKNYSSLQERVKKYSSFIQELTQEINKLYSKHSESSSYCSMVKEQLKNAMENKEQIEKELEGLLIRKQEYQIKLEGKKGEGFEKNIEDLTSQKNQLDSVIKNQIQLREKNKVIEEQNIKIKIQERQTKKKIQELSIDLNKHYLLLNHLESVYDIFRSKLPNFIALKYCNHLESIINRLLLQVYPYFKIKITMGKTTGIMIYYRKIDAKNGKWLNSSMLSGFESQLLSFAFKLALAKIYNIKILILDEIDSAANTQNSHKLFQLLIDSIRNLGFNQTLIVSHKPEILNLFETLGRDYVTIYHVSQGNFHSL